LTALLSSRKLAAMALLGVERLKVSALRENVADALRQALLEGKFQPGENLSEVAIAAELHVSRGPVREAMFVLAAEGLLNHTLNRGFSVLDFRLDDLEKIETVRVPLESLALSAARERADADGIRHLQEIKENLCRLYERGDRQGSLRAEIDFHSSIWEMSGNPWLVASLRRIMIPSFTYGTALRMNRPDLTPQIMDNLHSLYVDYLEGSSPHSAEACVRLHVGLPVSS
jgi:DNA-binding GntR family transcriptional regulator